MKQIFYLLAIISFINPNDDEKRIIEKIDFKTSYEFSADIESIFAEEDTSSWRYSLAASQYAMKGDHQNALRIIDLEEQETEEEIITKEELASINLNYSKVGAKDYIVEQAQSHQVIIINEDHQNPFHRVFTKSLLKELYDNGYKNLGLEALSNGGIADSMLSLRKYPIQKTGFYTKEPQFGDLIRTALSIGYNVFPYENVSHSNGKQREIEQAKNIQKIIDSKPNEKFLIHCGFDHVLEGTMKGWEKAMAGRLTEYTGINPLTINQVEYSEKSNPEFNHPLSKALNIKESSVMIDKEKQALKYEEKEAWTDIAIFHPNTQYIDNRPNWLFTNGNKNVSIQLTDIDIEYPVMVLAFKKGEYIHQAVPMDIVEISQKTDKCTLGLKQGVYEIIVTNKKDSFKFEQTIE